MNYLLLKTYHKCNIKNNTKYICNHIYLLISFFFYHLLITRSLLYICKLQDKLKYFKIINKNYDLFDIIILSIYPHNRI